MNNNKNAEEATPKFKFYTAQEMEERPTPEQLISGILPIGGFAELFGPPGIGKSFIIGDLAFCVATGIPWHDKTTKPVSVVCVVAEGVGAIGKRITAWRLYHRFPAIPNIHFLPQPLRLDDPDNIEEFIVALEALPSMPGLITIDTLSRCISGVEENSSKEMGKVVQNIDRLRQATGAAVLICHHTTKSGQADRGSSVIRGAADAMIYVKLEDKHSSLLRVECEKAKDLPEFEPFILSRTRYADSCVVKWVGLADKDDARVLSVAKIQILKALVLARSQLKMEKVPSGELKKLSNLKPRTFYQAIKELVTDGYVLKENVLQTNTYAITPTGIEVLRGMCKTDANATSAPTDASVHANPPSLEGDCSRTVTEPLDQQAGDDDQSDGPGPLGEVGSNDLS